MTMLIDIVPPFYHLGLIEWQARTTRYAACDMGYNLASRWVEDTRWLDVVSTPLDRCRNREVAKERGRWW